MLLAQGDKSTMNQTKYINQDTKAQFSAKSLPGRLNERLYSILLSCFTGRCLCVSFSLYLASDKKSAFEHNAVKGCLTFLFAPANLHLYPSDLERN